MAIKIENRSSSLAGKIVGFYVRRMLKELPKSDLRGIGTVYIQDDVIISKNRQKAAGLCTYASQHGNRDITISVKGIYEKRATIRCLIPLIGKFAVARTLFHEVGHCVADIASHGVKKRDRENFSNSYSRKRVAEYFYGWRPFAKIIYPLLSLLLVIER